MLADISVEALYVWMQRNFKWMYRVEEQQTMHLHAE